MLSIVPFLWLERVSREALFVVLRQAIEGDSFEGSRDVAVPLPVKPRVRNASALATQSTPQEKQKREIMDIRGVILLCFGCALLCCTNSSTAHRKRSLHDRTIGSGSQSTRRT